MKLELDLPALAAAASWMCWDLLNCLLSSKLGP